MAEQKEAYDTIKAYDEAGEQISKLQFLLAMLAENCNPLDYEGAMAGMYYILEGAIETLQDSTSVLYEAAMEGKAKNKPETAEDTDGGEDQAATEAETAEEDRSE